MNLRLRILVMAFFMVLLCRAEGWCQHSLPQILDSIRIYAQQRESTKQPYEANLKVKSNVEVLHKGIFSNLLPYLHKVKLHEGTFTQEYAGTLEHSTSDSTTASLTPLTEENSLIVTEFTDQIVSLSQKINIYSQYIYGNIYSPMAYLSGKYYDFSLDSLVHEEGENLYRIVFTPKIKNYKFVEGYMDVAQHNWAVRSMHIVGNVEFIQYCNVVHMGRRGSREEFLPTRLQVKIKGNFLGTRINGDCSQEFIYTRIGEHHFLPDSTLPAQHQQADTAHTAVSGKTQMGSFLVKDHSLSISNNGKLYIAPLVSPLMFHYSTHSGLSYTQRLKYTMQLQQDKKFTVEPLIGYNFKYNELYWAAKGGYLYKPENKGRIFIEAGNGVPQDFRTSYTKLGHAIQVAENMMFTATAAQLHYSWLNPEEHKNDRPSYTTFVPEVELQYHKHGYPAITVSYAHSIKGIFGSDIKFGRAEMDIQQKIDVGPMHSLTYRAGLGIAFNYNYLYFAEFKNLKNNHLPHGWDDDIGGTFNLLPSVKYNEIDKYLRANIQYDAPLLLVPTLLRRVKYINRERLYCNLLLVDIMNPYIEMGYGIGTNIFNMGIFWGGEMDKWDRIGVKFTFEIFN